MRAVIQRVREASVRVNGELTGAIEQGVLVFLGVGTDDTEEDIAWLGPKIINLRIFADDDGVMNRSLAEVGAGLLLVSQFTLHASTKKGNRPSYMRAAKPERARELYEHMKEWLQENHGRNVETGVFQADMQVSLVNDGPVTILIDSRQRE